MGTRGFMSPEQAIGRPVGPASDVFSFGGVLAFAATGAGPFGEGTPVAMVYRVVESEPALDDLPAALADLVRRCLVKRPEDRATLAGLMEVIGTNLTPVTSATSFWPQALTDFIDAFHDRFTAETQALAPPAGPPTPHRPGG
jgi:serine/threonine protein kinase